MVNSGHSLTGRTKFQPQGNKGTVGLGARLMAHRVGDPFIHPQISSAR